MADNTINIDPTILLRLIEERVVADVIPAVPGLEVRYMGESQDPQGDTTKVLRFATFDMQLPNRHEDGISADEGDLLFSFNVMGTTNGEGGSLPAISMTLAAVKVAFDRQTLRDATTTHQMRVQCTGFQIVDNAQPGSDNAEHGALLGIIEFSAKVHRASTLGIVAP